MKVRLYTKVTVNLEKTNSPMKDAKKVIYDPVSGLYTNYIAAEHAEEFLGEFEAREQVLPNGHKFIVINGKRPVRLDAETMTKETEVNVFRGEIV